MFRTLILVLGCIAATAGAHARPVSRTVSAIDIAPAPGGALAQFVVDIPFEPKAFALGGDNPRLVVDLPAARVVGVGAAPRRSGRIEGLAHARAVRFAEQPDGSTRLVFDLLRPATLSGVTKEAAGGGVRFQLRLSYAAADAAPASDRAERPVAPAPKHLVVIDAGHGGRDSGAIGPGGVLEKDVTLAAAKELRAELETRGFAVRLIREADELAPLETRVELARSWGADLFLSLHADSDPTGKASGASVYTLSGHGAARARRLGEQKDWLPTGTGGAVGDILFDLTQRSSVDRSALFADTLVERLRGAAPLLRNSKRKAGFYVLLAPDVPAVLLEMGFISHREDERRLSSKAGRAPLLKAVAEAVEAHFAEPMLLASNE